MNFMVIESSSGESKYGHRALQKGRSGRAAKSQDDEGTAKGGQSAALPRPAVLMNEITLKT